MIWFLVMLFAQLKILVFEKQLVAKPTDLFLIWLASLFLSGYGCTALSSFLF